MKNTTLLRLSFSISSFLIAHFLIGQIAFTEVAQSMGISHIHQTDMDMGGGVAVFDYNNDDWLDLFYTGGELNDALYQNNGNGTFTNVSIQANIPQIDSIISNAVQTGDIDNDGYREILIMTATGQQNFLLKNNGDNTFTDITIAAGLADDSTFAMSGSFGDFDQDGFLDIYIGNYVEETNAYIDSMGNAVFEHDCFPNLLYHNNGNGTFINVSAEMDVADDGCNLATTFTDHDDDGDSDIFIANDFGHFITPNIMYSNEYPSPFVDVAAAANIQAALFGMGIAIGDYDQDLDLDYYITNIGKNIFHENNGDGTFTEKTDIAGIGNEWVFEDSMTATGWGCGFFDIDNDSYLDLYVSNGGIQASPDLLTGFSDPDKIYINNGDNTFIDTDFGVDSLAICRGFAYGDIDNDGDLDLLQMPTLTDDADSNHINISILRNESTPTNNWLQVDLEGTMSNKDAFGSKIIIYVDGKSWLHEVSGGGSHASQHSSIAHFGLGNSNIVDSLIIKWPNGQVSKLENINSNQKIHVIEEEIISDISTMSNAVFSSTLYPNPAKDRLSIDINTNKIGAITVAIFNLAGQQIIEKHVSNNTEKYTIMIDTKDFENGLYIVKIQLDEAQSFHKLLKH